MKKNLILLVNAVLLTGILIFTGCEEEDSVDSNIIKPGTEYGDIAQSVIGRGYDISGRFAYSEDIKESVLDFNRLTQDNKLIKDIGISGTEVKLREGSTIREYHVGFDYSRTASVGVEGVFSGETGFNFGYNRSQFQGYSYGTVSSYTYKYGIYIDGRLNPATLYDYVSDQFLSDAASMDISELIDTYGTHVVAGGKWGASFDFSMCAQRTSTSNDFSFGAFVKGEATINGISVGGSQDISATFGTYYETSSKTITTKAKGGNSEHTLSITTAATAEGLDAAYAAWIETIDQNPVFCDYYQEGLVPVFEFIEDETLKTKVKNGITSYLAEKEIVSVAPVEHVIAKDFDAFSFCQRTGTGDGDVGTGGGKEIYIYLKFSVAEDFDDGNNLALEIEMKVHEKGGDYTKLESMPSKTIIIENPYPINSIELSNTNYTFSMQQGFPELHNYFHIYHWAVTDNPIPEWLRKDLLMVRIDSPGSDENEVGVKGRVEIPVTVWKVN